MLKQAICYLAEMLDENDELNIEYLKVKPEIIKVLIRSRHIKKKTYKSYIHYKPHSIGCGGILRYCCDCPNGLRTVGCCSHVAAVIYYLSNARYKSKILKLSKSISLKLMAS